MSRSSTQTLPTEQQPPVVVEPQTTVMLRNIPNNYKRDDMLELLESHGFTGQYDFIYLPLDFKTHVAIGYAFLNFTSHTAAVRAFEVFDGFHAWKGNSRKVCKTSWSDTHQGLSDNVELVRNSAMNRRRCPEDCKQIIIMNGQRVKLPAPNKK
jgi:RNA recognition motif-containing protein